MISRIGIRLYNQELIGNAELFEIRPPLKFKDVLVNDNEYEFLWKNLRQQILSMREW